MGLFQISENSKMKQAKEKINKLFQSFLARFNIGITRFGTLQNLREIAGNDIDVLMTLPQYHSSQLLQLLKKSNSQLRQDLFVLSELNFKKNGFFVEFGATNGIDLSNTYLLEKEFGWNGILAEPAKIWHKNLKSNRAANIETKCVWSESHSILNFNQVDFAELSTINHFSSLDSHKEARKSGSVYEVETISLNDLLSNFDAPSKIDYLSIDTEGSEFEILKDFHFHKYQFSVITCEHNFTPMREKIYSLLTQNGYVRKYPHLSQFDDWYIKAD
jgi:FkbM family methyltransferase